MNNPGNSLIQVSSPKKLIVFVPFFCNWYTQLSWWPSEEEVSDSAIFNIASTKLGIVPGMKRRNDKSRFHIDIDCIAQVTCCKSFDPWKCNCRCCSLGSKWFCRSLGYQTLRVEIVSYGILDINRWYSQAVGPPFHERKSRTSFEYEVTSSN